MTELSYTAHGKLLLTSEYFVLDGVSAIALPARLGQKLDVSTSQNKTETPHLYWQSLDVENQAWIDVAFDSKTFGVISHEGADISSLQNILRKARQLNPEFLQIPHDIQAKTSLEFPKGWGLGSSSTLIHLIAQWANVSPFELLDGTLGGSGYDVACAGAHGPILYANQKMPPDYKDIEFNPTFKNQLYFVYLNQKQDTRAGIMHYQQKPPATSDTKETLYKIVVNIMHAEDLERFEAALQAHENLVAGHIEMPKAKDLHFADYWGVIKSLGAWGGDFVLATSDQGDDATFDYFKARGYNTIFKYDDLILEPQSDAE